MDDTFNDLLIRRGISDPESIEKLAGVATALAGSASPEQVSRLVAIAHGQGVDRDADDWFWRPFRDVYAGFPSDDAELHGDVADACVRHRIDKQGDILAAALVRRAEFAGWTPASDRLQPAAATALIEAVPTAPSVASLPTSAWDAAVLKALPEDDAGAATVGAVRTALTTLIGQLKKAAQHAETQARQALEWATDLDSARLREVRCIEWMLSGRREDGAAWTDLTDVECAVGLAAELMNIVGNVPAPRHELVLAQMLTLANVSGAAIPVPCDTDGVSAPNSWLIPFLPVSSRLAGASGVEFSLLPADMARRLLWENSARAIAEST